MSSDPVKVSFSIESRSTLWNIIFEGFDQEVILVTNFYGDCANTVGILHSFAGLIDNKFKDCYIRTTETGLAIEKYMPTNDQTQINDWENLMLSLRDNIKSITSVNKDSALTGG
ncbi:MAG: hypothetical protein GWO07_01265 [Candidatus Dadabacteria bacterium]|nr:hypothetical protein [Candidatus Dadabacteria bacterium]NIS07405.1 hypothetical protein [Candidatus Dadabacteria bacterium]NIV41437.1 hypothetical protein [Candidatus Dadabacteria bacterium]NIY21061.1 hypothetical protein [Candidatus Dadabacteria bacterium]